MSPVVHMTIYYPKLELELGAGDVKKALLGYEMGISASCFYHHNILP